MTRSRMAREIGQAATLMYALGHAAIPYTLCGNYAAAAAQAQELVALAEEKGSPFWKAIGMMNQGSVLALTGRASDAIEMLISGIAACRTTGATVWLPLYLPHLARAHAELGQFEEAWRCIGEAMTAVETTKEKWCEAEVHRVAGEIALMSPEPDAAKAQAYFERALSVARAQQAKSWELRAATSLARLWRDQGKRDEARDLLAPIYGWFTEGFDTLDLKEAKALLGGAARLTADFETASLAPVGLRKLQDGVGYIVPLGPELAHFVGDVGGHVAGPAFSSVEGDDPDRIAVLARQQVADHRLAVSGTFVGLAPRSPDPTEVVQHEVGVLIRPVGRDGWRGTHDGTSAEPSPRPPSLNDNAGAPECESPAQ